MKERHALVDFESVQSASAALAKLPVMRDETLGAVQNYSILVHLKPFFCQVF